jgi:uncharacterized membrane protein
MVQRKRHLAKAVTYRVFGSAGTAAIAYVATGDAAIGATVGVLDSVVKIGLYYVHERLWYRVRWGVTPPAPPHTGSDAVAPRGGAVAAETGGAALSGAGEAPLVPTIPRHGRTNRTDLEHSARADP